MFKEITNSFKEQKTYNQAYPRKEEEEQKVRGGAPLGTVSGGKQQELEEVELIQNKFTKNIASPFINKSKNWDDKEHFAIPQDLQANILNNLGFMQPSNIQAVSIPLITNEPHHDLIA